MKADTQLSTPIYRVNSIDVLRGLIMIIMALDHTRDFFHETAMTADPLNPATTTPWLYFTRWVTHFCAPIFLFLSGISAHLASTKRTKAQASLFLITRGLWLVLIEITLVTFGITFNPSFNFIIFQVIWAIGWSMILLGIVSYISYYAVAIIGIVIVMGHNYLAGMNLPQTGFGADLWRILLTSRGAVIPLDQTHFLAVFYAILPWTGAMFLGYAIARWFRKDFPAARRQTLLIAMGTGMIVLFLVLRFTNAYGNPENYVQGATFLDSLYSFLNTSKYPPSLQYLCMTIGPGCLLLALFEKVRGRLTNIFSVYGRVPFFYYILHFYLIHILVVIVFYAMGYTNADIVDPNLPFYFRPLHFGFGLPVTYAIWLAVVFVLYFPSRWFGKYKQTHKHWWLSYV